MLSNWGAYNEIAVKSDERAEREKKYDEEQEAKKAAEKAKETQNEEL